MAKLANYIAAQHPAQGGGGAGTPSSGGGLGGGNATPAPPVAAPNATNASIDQATQQALAGLGQIQGNYNTQTGQLASQTDARSQATLAAYEQALGGQHNPLGESQLQQLATGQQNLNSNLAAAEQGIFANDAVGINSIGQLAKLQALQGLSGASSSKSGGGSSRRSGGGSSKSSSTGNIPEWMAKAAVTSKGIGAPDYRASAMANFAGTTSGAKYAQKFLGMVKPDLSNLGQAWNAFVQQNKGAANKPGGFNLAGLQGSVYGKLQKSVGSAQKASNQQQQAAALLQLLSGG